MPIYWSTGRGGRYSPTAVTKSHAFLIQTGPGTASGGSATGTRATAGTTHAGRNRRLRNTTDAAARADGLGRSTARDTRRGMPRSTRAPKPPKRRTHLHHAETRRQHDQRGRIGLLFRRQPHLGRRQRRTAVAGPRCTHRRAGRRSPWRVSREHHGVGFGRRRPTRHAEAARRDGQRRRPK